MHTTFQQDELTPFPFLHAAFVSHLTPTHSPKLFRNTHTHACKDGGPKAFSKRLLHTWTCVCAAGFHFGPRAMRFIQSHLASLKNGPCGTSSFQCVLVYCCSTLARSMSCRRSSCAYAPRGQISLAGSSRRKTHLVATSKMAPTCFAKYSGHPVSFSWDTFSTTQEENSISKIETSVTSRKMARRL